MKTVRQVAGWFLVVGVYYLVLAYAAGFSQQQSLVLALLLAVLSREIFEAFTPARRFSPYRVAIEPKWYQILTDFRVIGTSVQWDAVQQLLNKEFPGPTYHVLQRGIHFTVVQQSEDRASTLVYWDFQKTFSGRIASEEDLAPRFLRGDDFLEQLRDLGAERLASVCFFMEFGSAYNIREGITGYDLGIEVGREWWEEVKATCPAPLHERCEPTMYGPGPVRLTLARIPFAEFETYWDRVEYSLAYHEKLWGKIDEHRKKLGWKADETPGPGDVIIEHKYFLVGHSEL